MSRIIPINEDEFLAQVGQIILDQTPLTLDATISDVWFTVSALQLAARHPGISGAQRAHMEQVGRLFGRFIVERHPEAELLLEMGWNPDYDT